MTNTDVPGIVLLDICFEVAAWAKDDTHIAVLPPWYEDLHTQVTKEHTQKHTTHKYTT